MVEEGIRGGKCHAVYRYVKANNKYMKNYDENEESSILPYFDINNLYGWTMSQDLPVGGFKWIKNIHRMDENFIKTYDENGDIGFYFDVDAECPKNLNNLHRDLPFLSERMKVNKCNKLICNLYNEKTMLFI